MTHEDPDPATTIPVSETIPPALRMRSTSSVSVSRWACALLATQSLRNCSKGDIPTRDDVLC